MTTQPPRQILRVLDASLLHVTEQDDAFLRSSSISNPLTVYVLDYGFLVSVNGDEHTDDDSPIENEHLTKCREFGYSDGLRDLLRVASREGCDWIKLDGDGTVYPDLAQYVWQ